MKLTSALVATAAILLDSATAFAAPPAKPVAAVPAVPVVAVRYLVTEQSPERVEATVTNPIERMLVALPRVSAINSATHYGSVDLEIHFDEGATEQDLETVERHTAEFVFDPEVEVTARTTQLAAPRQP